MKKTFKTLSLCLLLATTAIFTSCDKNDDDNNTVTVSLNNTEIPYNSENVWTGYLTEGTQIVSQGVVFSHTATPAWSSWNGFVASRVNDLTDYSEAGTWLSNQYAAITGGGMSGKATPYLVSYWNSSESSDVTLNDASCSIKYGTEGKAFTPQSLYFTNTTYAYYVMINGSAYSKTFTTGDYLKLHIYGVKADGTKTGPVTAELANYTSTSSKPVNEWEYLSLDALGEVVGIYFQMESSDTGTWGINTPTYFAIDRLVIKVAE